MPKTHSRYQQDLGFTDGIIMLGLRDILDIGADAGAITQNAVGDNSLNWAASKSIKLDMSLSAHSLFRTGFGEDLQEQFGGTGIAASAEYQGRPDTIAAMSALQEITPRTANKIKGIKLLSVALIYQITGAALLTPTVRIDQTVFKNNTANAITSVLAVGANGLATAVQALPYVTEIPLAAGQQTYRITDLTQLWLEFAASTDVGGAFRFYGARIKVEFNFN